MKREGEYILSLSYGKDSLACLGAIEQLGWPLNRIVHAEVWATDTIPADLPPMVEFKAKADRIIKERWGIEVEHIRSKYTYQDGFYMVCGKNGRASKSKCAGKIYGWPFQRGPWCNSRLKQHVLEKLPKEAVQYVGIACDEPGRFHVFGEKKKVLSLKPVGMKCPAAAGARKTTCSRRSTPPRPAEAAGFAITKE